jgi:hypothetical protein
MRPSPACCSLIELIAWLCVCRTTIPDAAQAFVAIRQAYEQIMNVQSSEVLL